MGIPCNLSYIYLEPKWGPLFVLLEVPALFWRVKVLGLYYGEDAGPEWGLWQQLAVERTKNLVEVHTDISYANAEGHRSTHGVIALYAGAPIMWSTSRQPFAVASTAEAELVGLCEGAGNGEATAALITELGLGEVTKVLYNDNATPKIEDKQDPP